MCCHFMKPEESQMKCSHRETFGILYLVHFRRQNKVLAIIFANKG